LDLVQAATKCHCERERAAVSAAATPLIVARDARGAAAGGRTAASIMTPRLAAIRHSVSGCDDSATPPAAAAAPGLPPSGGVAALAQRFAR
jgi:hypothetical protein